MINKQLILGTVLGIFIGVSSSSFAYYNSNSRLTELTAGDLEGIVQSAVSSELQSLGLATSSDLTAEILLLGAAIGHDITLNCSTY
jgi:hypothetical protein